MVKITRGSLMHSGLNSDDV